MHERDAIDAAQAAPAAREAQALRLPVRPLFTRDSRAARWVCAGLGLLPWLTLLLGLLRNAWLS